MFNFLKMILEASPKKGDLEISADDCALCGSKATLWPIKDCSIRMYKANALCSNRDCRQYYLNCFTAAWNVIQGDIKKRGY